MESKFPSSDYTPRGTRVTDAVGGTPNLPRFFESYDQHFRDLDDYLVHVERLLAGYSRGDGPDQLREALSTVIEKVARYQQRLRALGEKDCLVFGHSGEYPELFQTALLLLSSGLCLRAPQAQIVVLANNTERGDPLFETLIAAAAPGLEYPRSEPVFYEVFDRLYDCLSQSEPERERSVREYLDVWYSEKMEGFAFKDLHLEADPLEYVGYWCFEAAGVVAALEIDDRTFSGHPHYPKELVHFYREGSEGR